MKQGQGFLIASIHFFFVRFCQGLFDGLIQFFLNWKGFKRNIFWVTMCRLSCQCCHPCVRVPWSSPRESEHHIKVSCFRICPIIVFFHSRQFHFDTNFLQFALEILCKIFIRCFCRNVREIQFHLLAIFSTDSIRSLLPTSSIQHFFCFFVIKFIWF